MSGVGVHWDKSRLFIVDADGAAITIGRHCRNPEARTMAYNYTMLEFLLKSLSFPDFIHITSMACGMAETMVNIS